MNRRVIVPAAIALVASILVFLYLYRTDNKYTYNSSKAENGILFLEDNDASLIYLTHGWEFYQYQLFTPEDFFTGKVPAPTDYITIGQYMGFDMNNNSLNPYGSATYRMNIFTGEANEKSYTLELPEIFSAYCLWINGNLMVQNGNPNPADYAEEITHNSITFIVKDRIDIIFAVTNLGHYYSGIIYPPAFGDMRNVNKVTDTAVLLSAVRCFFAAAVGLFYLFIGIFTREKKNAVAFGILCFLYAGSASHKLVHFVSSDYFFIWYAIEDLCFYVLLAGFVYIGAQMFQVNSKRQYIVPAIGIITGLCVVAFPHIFTTTQSLDILSLIVKFYKCIVLCYLFYILIRASNAGARYASALLSAVSVFGVSVAVDLVVRFYEPIIYGWPTEIGGSIMILVLGVIITIDAVNGLRERMNLIIINEQLTMSYNLLTQKIEQTKKSSHDLRHHMAVLSSFAGKQDMEGITSYVTNYLSNLPANDELHFFNISSIDAVVRYYYALAKNNGIETKIYLDLPWIALPEQDICVLFGNLLENAIEGCGYVQDRYIHFSVKYDGSFIIIMCDNSFDGIFIEHKGIFQSRKRNSLGIGTTSIKTIAAKYKGYANFSTNDNEFRVSVTLQINNVVINPTRD